MQLKQQYNADYFESVETDRSFSTGRRIYRISFYRRGEEGKRQVLAEHTGMRLVGPEGQPYMVCKREPDLFFGPEAGPSPSLEPSRSPPGVPGPLPVPPILVKAQSTRENPKPSEVTPPKPGPGLVLAQPQPMLQCQCCHLMSDQSQSFIECSSCHSRQFTWACACAHKGLGSGGGVD